MAYVERLALQNPLLRVAPMRKTRVWLVACIWFYTFIYVLMCFVFKFGMFMSLRNIDVNPRSVWDRIDKVVASEVRENDFTICFEGRYRASLGQFEFVKNFSGLPTQEERKIKDSDDVTRFIRKKMLKSGSYNSGCSVLGRHDFTMIDVQGKEFLNRYDKLMNLDTRQNINLKNIIFYNFSEKTSKKGINKYTVYLGDAIGPDILSFYPFENQGFTYKDVNVPLWRYGYAIAFDYVNIPRYIYNIFSVLSK